jgi:hypothetical protein
MSSEQLTAVRQLVRQVAVHEAQDEVRAIGARLGQARRHSWPAEEVTRVRRELEDAQARLARAKEGCVHELIP